jgi:hypothetical protein
MPINCKGINASGIRIPKSGIKYNQLIIVIRGEPINLVWPPKGFNKFKYNIRYTPVVMITHTDIYRHKMMTTAHMGKLGELIIYQCFI